MKTKRDLLQDKLAECEALKKSYNNEQTYTMAYALSGASCGVILTSAIVVCLKLANLTPPVIPILAIACGTMALGSVLGSLNNKLNEQYAFDKYQEKLKEYENMEKELNL